jgi:PAS domain-containing protein
MTGNGPSPRHLFSRMERDAAMTKTKVTADVIKQRNPLKHPNGSHMVDRHLMALDGTLAAPASASAPLTPIMKASTLRSRRADGHARNITRQSRSEEAIRDSEVRYRCLFEAAQDGILILDADTGFITDVNPFLMEFLDY